MNGFLMPVSYGRDVDDYGIGDLRTLAKAIELAFHVGQNLVEVLPLTFSSSGNSPYSVLSSLCFDTIYLNPSWMLEMFPSPGAEQWVAKNEETRLALKNSKNVEYTKVRALKTTLHPIVFEDFKKNGSTRNRESFRNFSKKFRILEDHLLFMLLRSSFKKENPATGWDFRTWPEAIRVRDASEIQKQKKVFLKELELEFFLQWVFHEQWERVQALAKKRNVAIMGDIPFSVDGADIWLQPKIFGLTAPDFKREFTQGAPPDYFSDFGQYWQFYPYQFEDPGTQKFLLERLAWNQNFFDVIRLDHVLGFYRAYLFYEDPEGDATLRSLKVWDALVSKMKEGHENPQRQGDLGWEAYQLVLKALRKRLKTRAASVQKDFFESSAEPTLKDEGMLLLARPSFGKLPRQSFSQYSVERAVFKNDSFPWRDSQDPGDYWDYLRISKKECFQEHEHWCAYLFAKGEAAPKPTDSLRPCFFKRGPGEKLIKAFLKQAALKGTLLICEDLGLIPKFVMDSLQRLKANRYLPLIFGMTPWDTANTYFLKNHEENALVTFTIHDSETLSVWWEKRSEDEKQKILDYLFKSDTEKASKHTMVGEKLQFALLAPVYKSKAKIKVLLWSDLLLSGEEGAINNPKNAYGQWVARMPEDLDALLLAASGKPSTGMAEKAVSLIRKLQTVSA
jgi:4-alpha-glucanotransferase